MARRKNPLSPVGKFFGLVVLGVSGYLVYEQLAESRKPSRAIKKKEPEPESENEEITGMYRGYMWRGFRAGWWSEGRDFDIWLTPPSGEDSVLAQKDVPREHVEEAGRAAIDGLCSISLSCPPA